MEEDQERSSSPPLPALGKERSSSPPLPTQTKERSSSPPLPTLAKERSSSPPLPTQAKERSSSPPLPTQAKERSSSPPLPTQAKERSSSPPLPTQAKERSSSPPLPTQAKERSSSPPLPTQAKEHSSSPPLPTQTKERSSSPPLPTQTKERSSSPPLPTHATERSSSPPLVTRGSYNIDFDALDDGFNPFQTKKDISSSPPLHRKDKANAEPVSDNQPASSHVQDDATNSQPGPVEKPKKKKIKAPSSKRASAVIEGDVDGKAGESTPPPANGNATEDAAPAEKPVKIKKVKKTKPRPVSKNLDGQVAPEKTKAAEGLEVAAPTEDGSGAASAQPEKTTTLPAQDTAAEGEPPKPQPEKTTTLPPQDTTAVEEPPKPRPQEMENPPQQAEAQPEKVPEKTQENVEEKTPKKVKVKRKEKTPEKDAEKRAKKVAEKTPEKVDENPPDQDLEKTPEKVSAAEGESPAVSKEPSLLKPEAVEGEDAVDSPRKKERSAGKVKKTKTKSRKSPRSSASEPGSEIDPSASTDTGKESKSSTSLQGEPSTSHVATGDPDAQKSKHPATRVLDQQVKEDSHSHARGDSDMADVRNTESVVKLVQVLKYSQSDWNKLRQELELSFQATLLAKEREWSGKLADRDARLATLEDTNKKLRQVNEDMRTVMAEFERTISQLQSEKEKTTNASHQSLQDVMKERDQALEDLQGVETAFSDLHRRYEKTKGVVDGFKQNEEMLKKCVQDLQNKVKKAESKVQVVKEQAEEKLERATEEIEKTQKSTASDVARLEAALRKAELQVQSMESSLDQKVRENTELAAICDELIAKVQ